MNYIREIVEFHRLAEFLHLPATCQLLWSKLMHIANEGYWPTWIAVDNFRLMSMCSIRTEHTLIKARKRLIEIGLIEFEKGEKSFPSRYKLNSCIDAKHTEYLHLLDENTAKNAVYMDECTAKIAVKKALNTDVTSDTQRVQKDTKSEISTAKNAVKDEECTAKNTLQKMHCNKYTAENTAECTAGNTAECTAKSADIYKHKHKQKNIYMETVFDASADPLAKAREMSQWLYEQKFPDDLMTALERYIDYRNEIRKPLSKVTLIGVMAQLQNHTNDTKLQIEILNRNIASAWRNLNIPDQLQREKTSQQMHQSSTARSNRKTNRFNDFPQRNINFEAIEAAETALLKQAIGNVTPNTPSGIRTLDPLIKSQSKNVEYNVEHVESRAVAAVQ